MAFISPTVTDKTKVTTSVSDLSKIQSGFTGNITEISKASSEAISSKVIAPVNGVTTVVTAKANSAMAGVNGVVAQVNSGVAGVNSYLQSAVKSITSTFDGGLKGLASGLDSALSGLFKDTNVKSASTVSTLISDPIKTNLIDAKLPLSSAFKISSFEAGSQTIGTSGSSSLFGSNAESMISTNLSTIMNRLNFDSVNGLASGITNIKSQNSIKGLFSTVKSVTQTVGGIASTVKAIGQVPNIVAASVTKSLENSLQSFLGRAGSLAQLTGVNASDYYLSSKTMALTDQSGNLVATTGSGTDANTANALLAVATLIGCDTNNVTEYSSVDELSSLFNMILSLASKNGLSSLVDSLLGCSMSGTTYGQQSVLNALTDVAGSDITLTNTLLSNISDSSVLYKNQQLARQIIANGNLTGSDASAVTAALATMGYTATGVFAIDGLSNGSIAVYDNTVLTATEKSLLDSLFEDKTVSTYLNGTTMKLSSNGTFSV